MSERLLWVVVLWLVAGLCAYRAEREWVERMNFKYWMLKPSRINWFMVTIGTFSFSGILTYALRPFMAPPLGTKGLAQWRADVLEEKALLEMNRRRWEELTRGR